MQIHQLNGYIQSIYLVEYPHGLFLLDGCSRPDVAQITDFITSKLQRPVTDLKLVFVSHMHPDHAGAAHVLRKKTGCEIASADRNTSWYSGFDGFLMFVTDLVLASWVAGRKGKSRKNIWYARTLKPDYKLKEADTMPGFSEWSVLETPGHTDRDLSVIHLASRRIYVADLIVKVKNKFVPPFPIFHPNKYKTSIDHILSMNPSSLILAHGGEVKLSEAEFQYLKDNAPLKPQTHWRAAKYHFRLMLQRS